MTPYSLLRLAIPCFLWMLFAAHQAEAALERRVWEVDGTAREALVALPAAAPGADARSPRPLVFIFHGHGGTMRHAARTFSLHAHWPEAVCIYMQGLPTVGRLTDPEGKKSGWQARAGDGGDRDLKFFDAVLASMKAEQKVDSSRIYATGHSNGGAFTYLLWGQRGAVLAAVAPSGAVALGHLEDLKPKPVLHIAGQKDALVRFIWQETTLAALRRLNSCEPGPALTPGLCVFPSSNGTPVHAYIYPGGHEFPPMAPAKIVAFFKEHPLLPAK